MNGVAVNKYVAMILASIIGMWAGMFSLKLMGQPTPLG